MNNDLKRLVDQWDLVPPAPLGQAPATRPVARRLATLAGARGAFLDNSKDNAPLLLAEVARLLERDHGAGPSSFFSKALHTRVAPDSQLEEAATLNYAVVAIGD